MGKKIDTIVWDLDETLVSSQYASDINSRKFAEEHYGQNWDYTNLEVGKNESYVTFLRGWAQEIISFSKHLVGVDNVYILSMGTRDYVRPLNKLLNLGIKDENIYGREDIATAQDERNAHPEFFYKNCILLDNENYAYHTDGFYNKVSFLHNLPENKFVEIPDFDVRFFNPKDDDDYFDILKERIVSALNS